MEDNMVSSHTPELSHHQRKLVPFALTQVKRGRPSAGDGEATLQAIWPITRQLSPAAAFLSRILIDTPGLEHDSTH